MHYKSMESKMNIAVYLVYSGILTTIAAFDFKRLLIPDKIVYPAMIVAFGFSVYQGYWLYSLLGGCLGFAILVILAKLYSLQIGGGDIKLGALIGFMVGVPLVFVALGLSFILAGIFAVLLLGLKLLDDMDSIPFAPFAALATIIILFFGEGIFWPWEISELFYMPRYYSR